MNIDLRLALPFVMPFGILFLARAIFWAAGAEWSEPGLAAFVSLIAGVLSGGFFAGLLFDSDIEIGRIRIGKPDKDNGQ